MVTKEHLAVSGCLQRAFHSFLGMFFQNISMSLVKHPDVLRKIVQKFFGLWASFSFSAGKSVCFRGKILYFLREYLSDAAVYLLKDRLKTIIFTGRVFPAYRRRILSLRLVSRLGNLVFTCLCKRYFSVFLLILMPCLFVAFASRAIKLFCTFAPKK